MDDPAPTDERIKEVIRELIPTVNLQETGIKTFIKMLGKKFPGVNLKPRNAYIKEALTEIINETDSEDEDSEDEAQEGDDKQAKPTKKGGGLAVKKKISKKLANFLQKGDEMARTDIVKGLWEYIREHNLQNPDNKREIILDDKMQAVFECEKFTMFTMNKFIGAHVHPFKPVDLTPKEKPPTKKRKRKDKDKTKTKRQSNLPSHKLSEALQQVVKTDVLQRTQVVQGIWKYIKEHDLQNPDDKREIFCDEKLKKVMGGKSKVTMFNMNTHITDHLLEKVDRKE